MRTDAKGEGASAGIAAGARTGEIEIISEGISSLYDVIKKIEADALLSDIRHEHGEALDALVKLAGRSRDIRLLSRLHNLISVLDSGGSAAEQKEELAGEISQVEKILQGRLNELKPQTKSFLADQPSPRPAASHSSELSFMEAGLRSFPAIGDKEILALKKYDLLDEDRFLKTDATALAKMMGLSTNAAFELKELLRRSITERERQDMTARVMEMQRINEQLGEEIERITGANNTMFMNNGELKTRSAAISAQHDQEAEALRKLQSRVADVHLESNRLSAEIDFLKAERKKLLDLIEEKHGLLDELLKRFTAVRAGYEFVSGETGFAEDIIAHLESMLNKALMQKKNLTDKIVSSEESLEKLFSDFNEIVKKGKMVFYKNI